MNMSGFADIQELTVASLSKKVNHFQEIRRKNDELTSVSIKIINS